MSSTEECAPPEGACSGMPALLDYARREVPQPAAQRLLVAAAESFAQHGFHATTTRDIASRAGLSPAALYVHFRSKEQLLYQLGLIAHRQALEVVTAVVEPLTSPRQRLHSAVVRTTVWHAENHAFVRAVQYELTSLQPQHLEELILLRQRLEELLVDIVESGIGTGEFSVPAVTGIPGVAGTKTAIVSLAVDVARWFREDDAAGREQLAELYARLALRMVGAGE